MTTSQQPNRVSHVNADDTSFAAVFQAELQEIRKRRTTLGRDVTALDTQPSLSPAAALGLSGLVLSGGGIRSATFSFGVIQALAKHHVLPGVDYLSTVSGGGYMGACLSSVLNDPRTGPYPDTFPFSHQPGVEESTAVKYLRNSSNYLAPGGLLSKLRIPFLLLRGILINLYLLFPLIMLAVAGMERAYKVGQNWGILFRVALFATLIGFLGLVLTSPFIIRFFRHYFRWRQRNRYELLSSGAFLCALLLVSLVPIIFLLVDNAIAYS